MENSPRSKIGKKKQRTDDYQVDTSKLTYVSLMSSEKKKKNQKSLTEKQRRFVMLLEGKLHMFK